MHGILHRSVLMSSLLQTRAHSWAHFLDRSDSHPRFPSYVPFALTFKSRQFTLSHLSRRNQSVSRHFCTLCATIGTLSSSIYFARDSQVKSSSITLLNQPGVSPGGRPILYRYDFSSTTRYRCIRTNLSPDEYFCFEQHHRRHSTLPT